MFLSVDSAVAQPLMRGISRAFNARRAGPMGALVA
ncbi:hypothetical protein ONO23_03243 [Micromonospora noduli]|nr:hypothetical protein ONO23_03243 [Micromonospora noduli]